MQLITEFKTIINPTVDVYDCIMMAEVICDRQSYRTIRLVPQRTEVILYPISGIVGAFAGLEEIIPGRPAVQKSPDYISP